MILKVGDDRWLQTLFSCSNFESEISSNLKAFALDSTASQIAVLINLNHTPISRFVTLIRSLIADFSEQESSFSSKVELDHIHINRIEGFWRYAKVRSVKYRGISKNSF